MKKAVVTAIAVCAFVFTAAAGAALVPGTFDPGKTGCVVAKAKGQWLHLEKNCATSTNASAGADITGASGAFVSASFTLKSAAQCQGGSPRFNIVTTTGTFFLGCNNVTPTTNADGTATYTFNAATLAAAGNQVPFPTGTITGAEVLIDVQGTADVKDVTLNGMREKLVHGKKHCGCGHGEHHRHHHHHHHHHNKWHR
jgi:hypothetical protein